MDIDRDVEIVALEPLVPPWVSEAFTALGAGVRCHAQKLFVHNAHLDPVKLESDGNIEKQNTKVLAMWSLLSQFVSDSRQRFRVDARNKCACSSGLRKGAGYVWLSAEGLCLWFRRERRR